MLPQQGPMQATEKLHAACDECRTRKLKCSGDAPKCVRCTREEIDCVYSPRKQMGRPKKRRREDEANNSTTVLIQGHNEFTDVLSNPSDMTNYPDFNGLISPSSLQETYSSDGSSRHENITPGQFDFSLPNQFDISPAYDFAPDLEPAIDPSLWKLQPDAPANNVYEPLSDQPDAGTCACLTRTWMTLTELQAVTSFEFPQVIVPLRAAMSALADIIRCPQCPKNQFSAIQNIQSIVSLMKAIIERLSRVLTEVDREAARLEEAGQKRSYRISESNPALAHLHTGTPDCPMGFNIDLDAKEWKRIVKATLKTEVYGNGSNPQPLLQLVKMTEARQEVWHSDRSGWSDEMIRLYGERECSTSENCKSLGSKHIRRMIDNLKWD